MQLGEEKKLLQTGETITISKRAIHRSEEAGIDAVILEISRGEFDKADIVRIEDDYKRIPSPDSGL